MFKSIIKLIKKLFFYFLLFIGMILSTSHLGDNYMGISDEEGYLLAIGICCLTAFIIEYLIPRIKP
jgi:predicted tellurium resistance membrane protein TerC